MLAKCVLLIRTKLFITRSLFITNRTLDCKKTIFKVVVAVINKLNQSGPYAAFMLGGEALFDLIKKKSCAKKPMGVTNKRYSSARKSFGCLQNLNQDKALVLVQNKPACTIGLKFK